MNNLRNEPNYSNISFGNYLMFIFIALIGATSVRSLNFICFQNEYCGIFLIVKFDIN